MERVYVSITGIGVVLFLPGTFLITFVFDVLCREDWKKGYRPLMKNKQFDNLLSNRLVQIFLVIVAQVVIQNLVLWNTPISLPGDPMLNDAIMVWHGWNAAQIAFIAVNIPWLLWLNYQEYQQRRITMKPDL